MLAAMKAAMCIAGGAWVLVLPARDARAWGQDGHRIIADASAALLPAALRARIAGDLAAFEQACIDPDDRKQSDPDEGPRHYVDIERFTEAFLKTAQTAH